MGGQRVTEALGRIERALARIESAATASPDAPDDGEAERLRAAHRALRGKVETAIAQIDRLLETEGAR